MVVPIRQRLLKTELTFELKEKESLPALQLHLPSLCVTARRVPGTCLPKCPVSLEFDCFGAEVSCQPVTPPSAEKESATQCFDTHDPFASYVSIRNVDRHGQCVGSRYDTPGVGGVSLPLRGRVVLRCGDMATAVTVTNGPVRGDTDHRCWADSTARVRVAV